MTVIRFDSICFSGERVDLSRRLIEVRTVRGNGFELRPVLLERNVAKRQSQSCLRDSDFVSIRHKLGT